MSFTQTEENRIGTIEDNLSSLATAQSNLATKRELKNLLALLAKDISTLKTAITTLQVSKVTDSELETVLNNLATKRELNNLIALLTRDIGDLGNQIEQVELTGSGNALADHLVDSAAHPQLDTRYYPKTTFTNLSTGAADANKPVLLNASGLIDPSMIIGDASTDNITIEPFTISIDPSIGSDTIPSTPIRSQADATTHGPFLTMVAAAKSLSSNIIHRVVFALANGTHVITDGSIFGDLSRLTFGWNNPNQTTAEAPAPTGHTQSKAIGTGHGHLAIRAANGYSRVAGTSVMNCTAVSEIITLSSDPGFSANQYRGYYLRSLSGANTDVKAIRNHSGVTFNISGTLSGATSVEIVQANATLNVDALTRAIIAPRSPSKQPAITGCETIVLEEVDIVRSSVGMTIFLQGGTFAFRGCRTSGIAFALQEAFISLDDAIIDGKSLVTNVLSVRGGRIRSYTSDSSWITRGGTNHGVALFGGHQDFPASIAQIFKGASDDNGGSGYFVESPGSFLFAINGGAKKIKGSGNARYGVEIRGGGYYEAGLLNFPPNESDYLTGKLGDMSIDGISITYATLNSVSDGFVRGPHGSTIEGNRT